MTKTETVKIMAMLSAFYGSGKGDPHVMANAWYMILKDYDYKDAETAVVRFARNDKRDYASFPPPGKIVELIEREQGRFNRLFNSMHKGTPYTSLVMELREMCPEEMYQRGVEMDPEELLGKREEFISYIRGQEMKLLGGSND